MRIFVGINFPKELKRKIYEVKEEISELSPVKWVNEENLHITLKFIGEISERELSLVDECLREVLPSFKKFKIRIRGVGVFPNFKSPKVIWFGIEDRDGFLSRLAESIEEGLAKRGFRKEGKEFRPHLTIGRVKGSLKNSDILKRIENREIGEMEVDNVGIIKSVLTPGGPIYTSLKVYNL